MRRAQAILALIALLASPLALLARSEACADACTKSCCVALHHSAAGQCHSSNQAPSARCCEQPTSNHPLDYGFTILMPVSILPNAVTIEAPAISGTSVASNSPLAASALRSVPFEPPRA